MLIIITGLVAFHLLLFWIAGGLLDGTALDPEAAPRGAQEFLQILLLIVVLRHLVRLFPLCRSSARAERHWASGWSAIRVAAQGGGRACLPKRSVARNLLRDIELFYPLVFIFVLLCKQPRAERISARSHGWRPCGLRCSCCSRFSNRDALRAGDIYRRGHGWWTCPARGWPRRSPRRAPRRFWGPAM